MRRLSMLLAPLILVAAAGKRPGVEKPMPPVGVTSTHSGGARVLRAVAPGTVDAVELPRRVDGRLDLVLLLGRERSGAPGPSQSASEPDPDATPEDRTERSSLVRVDLGAAPGEESLQSLLDDLPAGELGALDVDVDGAEDVLLAADGKLYTLGSATAPRPPSPVLETAETLLLLPSRWSDVELDGVAVSSVGRARLFLPGDAGLAAALDVGLPTRALRESRGVVLRSPPVAALAGDRARLISGPEAVGRQRLRSLLLDAGSASEAWSLLPAPEAVDTAVYTMIDGTPTLIVVTTNAGRIGIFEKKKLRVFALESDRTQAGHAPLLATHTTSHRWLPVTTTIADVDRDGHDDLIVLQLEGMGGGELVVETFFGRGEGRFAPPGRRQKLEVRSEASSYGRDLTGDGIADLAVVDADALLVFAGTGDARRALLDRKPLVTVGLGAVGSSIRDLRCADLDADGTSEVILLGDAGESRDVVLVVALAPRS